MTELVVDVELSDDTEPVSDADWKSSSRFDAGSTMYDVTILIYDITDNIKKLFTWICFDLCSAYASMKLLNFSIIESDLYSTKSSRSDGETSKYSRNRLCSGGT